MTFRKPNRLFLHLEALRICLFAADAAVVYKAGLEEDAQIAFAALLQDILALRGRLIMADPLKPILLWIIFAVQLFIDNLEIPSNV